MSFSDTSNIMGGIYGDGIIAMKGAFTREWVQALGDDIAREFDNAMKRPGGGVARGPNRWYVETQPELLRGFVELATHPWVRSVCEAVLGPEYKFVEVGFDVAAPGSMKQPWHRDFASPPETRVGRKISSLAFNLSTIDVSDDTGPFEIAPGTQWDDGASFKRGMFPDPSLWVRYEERGQRKMPQMGAISARTALALHRGTANRSQRARPVLVLGVEAPDATKAIPHKLQMTHRYFNALPDALKSHLDVQVVDVLVPIVSEHGIAGLEMGLM
jgi:hypothetical protein